MHNTTHATLDSDRFNMNQYRTGLQTTTQGDNDALDWNAIVVASWKHHTYVSSEMYPISHRPTVPDDVKATQHGRYPGTKHHRIAGRL